MRGELEDVEIEVEVEDAPKDVEINGASVNIGSNLTYVGSLANLLWRRIVSRDGVEVSAVGFSALGLVAGPPSIIAAVAALWLVS